MDEAINAQELVKSYGSVRALSGVSLTVPQGTVLGLLGPNGAGKTTVVRLLATLLRPDSGSAKVAGYDVVSQPDQVRAAIGLAGQYAGVDVNLTGQENLILVGRLLELSRVDTRRRATELLERFDLTDAATRPVRTYSGGMRRRLDLAAALVHSPDVLFLDEPTTGLDPRSRQGLWDVVEELVRDGTTVLLTTQYLEEADHLADRIAVVDHGRIIVEGTAEELKSRHAPATLQVDLPGSDLVASARDALRDVPGVVGISEGAVRLSNGASRLEVRVTTVAEEALATATTRLVRAGIEPLAIASSTPSLDDVFLSITGHRPDEHLTDSGSGEPGGESAAHSRRRPGRRRPSRSVS
ncbi:MAG: ATP-binding cassette domain-containing protein [Actinomycetota bacterium]